MITYPIILKGQNHSGSKNPTQSSWLDIDEERFNSISFECIVSRGLNLDFMMQSAENH